MKTIGILFASMYVGLAPAGASPAGATTSSAVWADGQLKTLIEQSLAVRPELAAARADVTAARERVPQARALPDPMLQLGVQNDGFTSWEIGTMDTSYYSIMVSQTFLWPRKRRLRGAVAELEAVQAEQAIARVSLSTEAEVRRAYLGLILTRDRLTLLDQLESLWQRSAEIAKLRYETAQGSQADVLRGPLELNRIKQRRWALEAERANNVAALNRLRGHPLQEAIEPASHLVDLPLPVLRDAQVLAQDALARSPELAASRVAITRSERAVTLARAATLPDLTMAVGVMPRGTDLQPMWLVTASIPLPVFAKHKQDRAVAETIARGKASKSLTEALEQRLRLRVEQRRAALELALASIQLYREGLLVQSAALAESTLAQYAVGKVTLASVLEANAGLVADHDGYLQALAQVHQLEIDSFEVSLQIVGTAAPTAIGDAASMGSM